MEARLALGLRQSHHLGHPWAKIKGTPASMPSSSEYILTNSLIPDVCTLEGQTVGSGYVLLRFLFGLGALEVGRESTQQIIATWI